MATAKKIGLKITMLETEKEQIRKLSEEFGFNTISGFVLAMLREQMARNSLALSREVIKTIDRLNEFERNSDKFANLPKKDRRMFAAKTTTRLLALCSDGSAS